MEKFICSSCGFTRIKVKHWPFLCQCGRRFYSNGVVKVTEPKKFATGYGVPKERDAKPRNLQPPPEKPKDLPKEVEKWLEG